MGRQSCTVANPPFLEMDRDSSLIGVIHDHVSFSPLIAHGQQGDTGLPAIAQSRRDLSQGEAGCKGLGTD